MPTLTPTAQTEHRILTTYLLHPAALSTIISLPQFIQLFPRNVQTSARSEIERLYRALQRRQNSCIDKVGVNIEREVEEGQRVCAQVIRQRIRDERPADGGAGLEARDEEVKVEEILFGEQSNLPVPKLHTLQTIIPDLERAQDDVNQECAALEEELADLLKEIRTTVSSLSDLRYGKFANTGLGESVREAMKRLENACDSH